MRSGPAQSAPSASEEEPTSQPASRPMISMTETMFMSLTVLSRMSSLTDVAMYLAAEPKPGVWSVMTRSLSMVFGTPMKRMSLPMRSA